MKLYILSISVLMAACSVREHSLSAQPEQTVNPLIVVSTSGWSDQSRVTGEYLITVNEGVGPEIISDLYTQFGVKVIQKLGENLYQINIDQDPGPQLINDVSKKSKSIKATQPNFIYRAN
jgi:hypothetical protein